MISEPLLRAAVIGLGKVGSRFDEEPRPSIWSHAGAYLALPGDYELVAGVDPADEQRTLFQQRCLTARVLGDAVEMVRELRPDVISVCTPPNGRAALVEALLTHHKPRALICEKPLELGRAARARIVSACDEAGVPLLVNYTRRFDANYRAARDIVMSGKLGRVLSMTVTAPNRLWSIGSHAVNLVLYMFGRPESWQFHALPWLEEGDEPAADIWMRFSSSRCARIATEGFRDMLVFDVELVGTDSRLLIRNNGAQLALQPFVQSPSFVGYRVPGELATIAPAPTSTSPFVTLAMEAAALARGTRDTVASSSGADACASEDIIESIVASISSENA